MKLFTFRCIVHLVLFLLPFAVAAQTGGTNPNGSNVNAIPVQVPFLNIAPDSRSGAMGEAGVAISPDVNANFWNPAKLAFLENNDALALSYSPWLRHLVPDISLSYLSYAHKLSERNTLGASLRYFNYGSVPLTDINANDLGTYTPNELSFDVSFARTFGENLSLGLTMRYIRSNISSIGFAGGSGQVNKPGNAVAADVSLYYKKPYGDDNLFAFGAHISNIGSKISYSDVEPAYFLPANLKIGAANTWNFDETNQLTLTLDLNKLLVPTGRDSTGIITDVSVPSGIFRSFTDARGGLSEELKEISLSPGAEYWYNQQFALRAGYFYENPSKGGRHYLTLGFGLKYDIFNFDFSYLAASQQNSALANTLRFTLSANFGGTTNASRR
ncbi:type IX secretion system outer membrane channel protein PorV [Mucilaginibacter sabulilitoris]|uniref:Type IX secretion system outer membrane channel protein PorV n=1 Tax=Mucilaginibacter sabulilitoris TaxID=1173583 RepID=A0ABZ0TLS4_9SPHI|nr:type IX secretion system outer membrane channel protein PorV [Mucilaginibacter sabulilitoris]WPU93774.1 type IX secretion system outer membrane channel protein PorV [Mucilaginibacter sabulilitoris]